MQDTVFNVGLFLDNPSIVYVNKEVYCYRIVQNSATHKYSPEFEIVAKNVEDRLKDMLANRDDKYLNELLRFKKISLLLETIKLSYAHPQCELNYKEKILGIKLMCEDNEIASIIFECRAELFNRKQRIMGRLLAKKHYTVLYFLYFWKIKFGY